MSDPDNYNVAAYDVYGEQSGDNCEKPLQPVRQVVGLITSKCPCRGWALSTLSP
jgi:hypothetical protein